MPRKSNGDAETRAYLESLGIDAGVLDEPAPSVADVVMAGDDPFEYIGADSARLADMFRLSWVPPKQVERLKRQGFTVVADNTDGKAAADVKLRGVDGGVVMGRPHAVDATYKAARAKQDYERRSHNRTERETWGGRDGGKPGRFSLSSRATPASVSDN